MQTFSHLLNQYVGHSTSFEIGFTLLVFMVAYLESFAIVGFIMPGTLLLFGAAGIALRQEVIPLFILAAAIGGFFADLTSFYLGTKGNAFMTKHTHKYQEALKKTHRFFEKYGAFAVILGKIIGTLRPLMAFVAGTSKMNPKKFTFFTAIASILWATSYVVTIYYFGRYIHFISKTLFLTGIVVLVVILAYWIAQQDKRPSSSPDLSHLKKHKE